MAGLTTALLVGSTLLSGYGAIKNAQAQREQAEFQAEQDKFNATIAGFQAEDAIARGEQEAQNLGTQARVLKGQQISAAAASGIDVGTGSAADIQAETDRLSSLDIISIKNNAAREAFGYKAQAAGYNQQSEMTRRSGIAKSNDTLLTGGANFIAGAANSYTAGKKFYDERKAAKK